MQRREEKHQWIIDANYSHMCRSYRYGRKFGELLNRFRSSYGRLQPFGIWVRRWSVVFINGMTEELVRQR